jgi:hypothetical protein
MHADPVFNALLAAVLGVLAALCFGADRPWEYKGALLGVAVACAALGFFWGEPVVTFFAKLLGFGAPRG